MFVSKACWKAQTWIESNNMANWINAYVGAKNKKPIVWGNVRDTATHCKHFHRRVVLINRIIFSFWFCSGTVTFKTASMARRPLKLVWCGLSYRDRTPDSHSSAPCMSQSRVFPSTKAWTRQTRSNLYAVHYVPCINNLQHTQKPCNTIPRHSSIIYEYIYGKVLFLKAWCKYIVHPRSRRVWRNDGSIG